MARVNVADVDKYSQQGSGAEFFKLENDQDTAMVRFIAQSVDDLDVLAVHEIQEKDKKFKSNVSCLKKDYTDPDSKCPLCEAGYQTSILVILQMFVYQPDKDGYYTTAPKQVVWQRGKSYLKKLTSLCNTYCKRGKGLIDTVFEITRNGAKGDMKTTYEILPALDLDDDECIIPEDYEKIDPLGTIILDKSYNELQDFVDTGAFENTTEKTNEPTPTRRERVKETVEPETAQTAPSEEPVRRRRI